MDCRIDCGACCIAPSIATPFVGMPHGKPAGVRCAHLTTDNRCQLFNSPERPEVCRNLQPSLEMCKATAEEAYAWLSYLEQITAPSVNDVVD